MRIDQVIMGAAPGDAITSMAVRLRDACRYFGPSEIFALHISPEAGPGTVVDAQPISLYGRGAPDDVVIYHSSMGDPRITDLLERCRAKVVVHFHNITPHEYFVGVNEVLAMSALWGREELQRLQPRCVAASADSSFNASELEAIGFRDVYVAPVGLVPDRLALLAEDGALSELGERFPDGFVVSVSQQLPHKRTELAIGAVHLLQSIWGREIGLVVVGGSPAPRYVQRLMAFAHELQVSRCEFWGRVSDPVLASAIRAASVLVVASDHEGLSIPPLEAMSMGTPVVARDCGAVGDTLADGALKGAPESGPEWIAAAVQAATTDDVLRATLVGRGLDRVELLAERGDVWAYLRWLRSVV